MIKTITQILFVYVLFIIEIRVICVIRASVNLFSLGLP